VVLETKEGAGEVGSVVAVTLLVLRLKFENIDMREGKNGVHHKRSGAIRRIWRRF
jgi:hypothetical protein